MSGLTPEQYVKTAEDLMAAKMYSLAACVMIYYDIMLTFADEVELIWSKKFSFFSLLWYINRYVSPLGYVVIIVSFHDRWSDAVCDRYILFPEALKISTSLAIGVIFILRLYALYQGRKIVVVLGSILLAGELGIKIWAFTCGTRLQLPPGLVGCILVGKPDLRIAFTWISELIFDSIVFFATLYRAISSHSRVKGQRRVSLFDVMIRDGVIYFGVIFVANLLTVLMFMLAPADIKAINASFSTLITNLMVSRMILHMRSVGSKYDQDQSFELNRVMRKAPVPNRNQSAFL
ncbi:hypothetical protein APHAL10511_003335 [Amanita phalloides]|nr:hypothetical protein APHAL10511_003335 [Amanita phalloides]